MFRHIRMTSFRINGVRWRRTDLLERGRVDRFEPGTGQAHYSPPNGRDARKAVEEELGIKYPPHVMDARGGLAEAERLATKVGFNESASP